MNINDGVEKILDSVDSYYYARLEDYLKPFKELSFLKHRTKLSNEIALVLSQYKEDAEKWREHVAKTAGDV